MSHRNNLTALRWLAAGMVLYGHSFTFLGLQAPLFMEWAPLGVLGVYIFFAISGYLVAQSWESDPHPVRFLQRRALRIFPALTVCIVLSVFLLGPLLTTLPLFEYFSHPHTRGYFSNIALYITHYLPGVFETNRVPHAVNGSLWSLPAEFSMYLALVFLGLLRVGRLGWVAAAAGLMLLAKFWALQVADMLVIYGTDLRQVVICGTYFWVGAIFYRYGIKRIFSTTSIFVVIIVWLCLSHWKSYFVMASWLALPFLVLAFGLASNAWLSRLAKYDYSYGIYIYAFPIQQTVANFWPDMSLGPYLVITIAATLAFAALSWHWIEGPALRLKPTQRAGAVEDSANAITTVQN